HAFEAHDLVSHLSLTEKQHRWDRPHAVLSRQGLFLVDVHFANFDLAIVLIGQFIQDRRERPAWAAPLRPKIHEHRRRRFKNLLRKALLIQIDDIWSSHKQNWKKLELQTNAKPHSQLKDTLNKRPFQPR